MTDSLCPGVATASRRFRHYSLAAAASCALLIGATGCGSSGGSGSSPSNSSVAAPPTQSLPPRPTSVPLNRVEPCKLLVGPAAARLGVNVGNPTGRVDLGNAQCQWANYAVQPVSTWLAHPLLNQPASAALRNPHDDRVVSVDGFPAVQTTVPGGLPDRSCALYVDVAQGQSLLVEYLGGVGPSMNHAVACQRANQAADAMVRQLRTLVS